MDTTLPGTGYRLSRERMEEIADAVLRASEAEETEVLFQADALSLTRFAENRVTQNVVTRDAVLNVRVQDRGRVGRFSTTRIEGDGPARAVAAALDLARHKEAEPGLLPLPSPEDARAASGGGALVDEPSGAWVQATAQCSPEHRASVARTCVGVIRGKGGDAHGSFSTSSNRLLLANSKGLKRFHQGNRAVLNVSATADRGGAGWAEASGRDVREVDAEAVAGRAVDKALASRDPRPIEPGRYTVVLEPDAVSNLTLFMAWLGFSGLCYLEGRSFASGRLGEKLFSESISIDDDARHPLTDGMGFDLEGMSREKVGLVERGVLRGVVHDRETALQAGGGARSTGHSLPKPNSMGPLPMNLVLHAGDTRLEDMIASTERGILVTRFHYTNVIDPVKLSITGMTRDGTFLIEGGRVSHPVRNLRFTESVVEALARVLAVGREQHYSGTLFGGGFVVPALKIADFNFSSCTEF